MMFKPGWTVLLPVLSIAGSPCPAQTSQKNILSQSDVKVGEMFAAIAQGRSSRVALLLNKGVSSSRRGHNGMCPLGYAAGLGEIKICKLLLKHSAKVEEADSRGFTPLMNAARNGKADVVRLLIEKGADVNARDPYNDTPLIQAAYYGYTRVVTILIHHKADVNAQDDRGRTAFSIAIDHKSGKLAAMLRKAGAK